MPSSKWKKDKIKEGKEKEEKRTEINEIENTGSLERFNRNKY